MKFLTPLSNLDSPMTAGDSIYTETIPFDAKEVGRISQPLPHSPGEPYALSRSNRDMQLVEGGDASMVELVRTKIHQLLTRGEIVTSDRVARILGMSRRSMHRHLSQGGTTFRQLFEDIRREKACRLLRRAELSIMEIALALGFADASTFSRAFRRWFGVPPSTARMASRPAVAVTVW